jgi:beta-phosphoglucomutase-like phosphatase (HAD superfamily)
MEFDNYIFDFDGTIINSQRDVFLCFEKAFEKENYKIDKILML